MPQNRIFDDINARVSEVLAKSPVKDIEKNLRGMLSSAFSRLDLVSREEFDVQAKVLARTREKLVAIEARVSELEKKLDPKTDSAYSGRVSASTPVAGRALVVFILRPDDIVVGTCPSQCCTAGP